MLKEKLLAERSVSEHLLTLYICKLYTALPSKFILNFNSAHSAWFILILSATGTTIPLIYCNYKTWGRNVPTPYNSAHYACFILILSATIPLIYCNYKTWDRNVPTPYNSPHFVFFKLILSVASRFFLCINCFGELITITLLSFFLYELFIPLFFFFFFFFT